MTSERVAEQLPRRTAHALYALLIATREHPPMPRTAAEVCIYDEEALSPRGTAAALRNASRLGLCFFDGRYWWTTPQAGDLYYDLERRVEDERELP